MLYCTIDLVRAFISLKHQTNTLTIQNVQQDIQFKVQRHQQQIMYRTNIRHDCPWKLHQVQDAGNHLRQAILQIEKIDKETIFKYCLQWYGFVLNYIGSHMFFD